jgi:hypothetical protein
LDAMTGRYTQQALADKYGVTQACISLILNHNRHKIHR